MGREPVSSTGSILFFCSICLTTRLLALVESECQYFCEFFVNFVLQADHNHLFFLNFQINTAAIATLASITAGYPYFHLISGIYEKFIPYHPTRSESRRNITVTTVKTFIKSFCSIDSWA